MKKHILIFIMALFVVSSCKHEKTNLICYVGGTMRPPMEEIVGLYEKKTGTKVDLDFGNSGELLTRIKETRKGDLIVVHDPFFAESERKNIALKGWTLAYLNPVIIVSKGNPKNIKNINDLAQGKLKIILTDPDYSTTGHIVTRIFSKMDSNIVKKIKANIVSYTRGGYEAANAVVLKTADIAIAWDAVAFLRKDQVDVIPINPEYMPKPSVDAITSATYGVIDLSKTKITLILLKYSSDKDKAQKLVDFINSDEAKAIWLKHGFAAAEKDNELVVRDFSQEPLFIFCAAGLRKVMDKLIMEFENKYKKPVNVSYDGSNRLLGQLKLTKKGDVFIPGDADYVQMANKEGLIEEYKHFSNFIPVILVNKKCKVKINNLRDLIQKGIRIGQGDTLSAAIGRITNKILYKNNISETAWNKNVVLSAAMVNELGLAIKLGTIDAAIIWKTIALDYQNEGRIIPIEKEKNVIADIEVAIIKNSTNKETAKDFLNFITSEECKQILTEYGY
jgi:molybdate transport system substrate-binding protein